MNVESLPEWLTRIGVPDDVVSLGEETDQRWCLLADETGYEVFWQEQGNRYDWARFDDESVACHYLFGRLAWAQVARGSLTVPTA
ncbi:hypothetical protein SAMN04488564_103299 [Lentzea waywayandensis]|uniref:Uncharacterized protein n=1 Tax=Lentzea waywayandensis TaxID=84724 RepID=A0A1I6DX67_9PSEU|nr:hypothetical protein [Lentzea waywayandensis]SFR10035.1 hypothetical protein SAMN04488564_103299 [Lentzea waywayandensis]